MTHADVQPIVLSLLRELTMVPESADVDLGRPLGDSGLGLGSLALVRLVTAIEHQCAVTLPDEVWADAGRISGNQLVDTVVSLTQPAAS